MTHPPGKARKAGGSLQAQISDLNRDGGPEATLLVWRPFQPWPVDQWLPHGGRIESFHDDQGNSCHIILIGWRGSAYGELWAGSALAGPVRSFAAADLNGDGSQELLTLEGSYAEAEVRAGARLEGLGMERIWVFCRLWYARDIYRIGAGPGR